MSHPTPWTCRSCRAVLGEVRDGVLHPVVPVGSVDGRGAARLACPQCGRVRVWEPSAGCLSGRESPAPLPLRRD